MPQDKSAAAAQAPTGAVSSAVVDLDDARALMALAGMARWSWEPDSGLVLSSEMAQMLGSATVRPVSRAMVSLCHPDDRRKIVQIMDRATREGGSGAYEHRYRSPNGRWLHLRVVYKTEPRGPGAYAVQGMVQDITELAEARDAALRGEHQVRGLMEEARIAARRLKLALGAAQAGVFEIDHEAAAFWCSPEFVLLIGRQLTYHEACAVPWPFVHPDDRQAVIEAAEVWRTGALLNEPLDLRVVRPDGAVRWMRLYYELRRDVQGRPRRSVGLILDVDERKRQELALVAAERAAQAGTEAKSAFLASVSHEIRTPMNGVLGVLHLLKSEELTEGGRSLLDEALACGNMLSELINDVLDLSKIEADQMNLAPEPTNAVEIMEGVVRLLRPQAEAKGLTLKMDVVDPVAWAMVDPIRLRQILFNLAGNAVKFTVQGGVVLRLGSAGDGAERRLRFEIQDTGVGIPEWARASLFDRFQQADSSTTRRFGGTGLGLSITKRLAAMMDGDVWFESVEGLGSTFWLDIAAPPAEAAALEAEALGWLDGLKILVVEDNATNRLIAARILENLGGVVSTAEDGEKGVEAARTAAYDLILMDVQMPGMDGLEATRHIRALPGPAGETPIIALTANVLSHQKTTYCAAGMDGVVAKPISPQALMAEISRVAGLAADAAVEAA